jgi:hypothetical protein
MGLELCQDCCNGSTHPDALDEAVALCLKVLLHCDVRISMWRQLHRRQSFQCSWHSAWR